MKNVLYYVNESRKETIDLGRANAGGADSFYNRAKMVDGDYEKVALLFKNGDITWMGRFKKTNGKNIDAVNYKTIMDASKKRTDSVKLLVKIGKQVSKLLKGKKPFKIQDSNGVVREIVQNKGRIFYKINNEQTFYSHTESDLIHFLHSGDFNIVESNDVSNFVVGQPVLFGGMETKFVSLNEGVVTLDLDGEEIKVNESEINESVKAKYTDKQYIEFTDKKLKSWYKNAKKDYGVVGSGKASIKDDEFTIKYVENGNSKEWSIGYFPSNREELDFYYNVWSEQGEEIKVNESEINESVKAKYTDKQYIEFTDKKLKSWYKNAKKDYGVVGSGKASIKDDEFTIKYVENGNSKEWSIGYFPSNREELDFYYNVWTEQG